MVATSNIIVILLNMPGEMSSGFVTTDTFGYTNLDAFRFLFQNVTSIGVARVPALYTLQYLVFVIFKSETMWQNCTLSTVACINVGIFPWWFAWIFNERRWNLQFCNWSFAGTSLQMHRASFNNLKLDVNGHFFCAYLPNSLQTFIHRGIKCIVQCHSTHIAFCSWEVFLYSCGVSANGGKTSNPNTSRNWIRWLSSLCNLISYTILLQNHLHFMRLSSILGVTDRGILSQHIVNLIISALLVINLFLIIVNCIMYLGPFMWLWGCWPGCKFHPCY
jgi:hypothetical protein